MLEFVLLHVQFLNVRELLEGPAIWDFVFPQVDSCDLRLVLDLVQKVDTAQILGRHLNVRVFSFVHFIHRVDHRFHGPDLVDLDVRLNDVYDKDGLLGLVDYANDPIDTLPDQNLVNPAPVVVDMVLHHVLQLR